VIPARATRTSTILTVIVGAVLGDLAAAGLLVLAFRAIGSAAFGDDPGGFLRGGAVLAAAFALEAAATALGGVGGAAATVRLRRHVLATELTLDPDRNRALGAGDALAIGLDLDLVGAFLIGTAPAAALGVTETVAGAWALTAGPAPVASIAVAAVAAGLVVGLLVPLTGYRRRWDRERGTITARLVERLVGHRTVTIQDNPARTHTEGASRSGRYRLASLRLDRTHTAITAVPLFALFALVVVLTATSHDDPTATAAGLGGALLTAAGLGLATAAAPDGAAAHNAYRNLRRLDQLTLTPTPPDEEDPPGSALLTAHAVTATYTPNGTGGLTRPISITVEPGDIILLTGASGSGKTTLGEVLSTRRTPSSGRLHHSPGTSVVRVPQAGDDHVFHASLLFNVLCATTWPAEPVDARAAVTLLTDLGLGPLIDRMPAGLGQPLGDGGWRLSSGERARISLARALITQPDVLILDETTAALDPHTRETLLEVARAHSRALILIAHP